MISDFSTSNLYETKASVDYAKNYEGVEMVSVSIGAWVNPSLLQYIASEPKEDHIFQVCTCEDLDELVNLLVKIFCIPSEKVPLVPLSIHIVNSQCCPQIILVHMLMELHFI